MESVKNPVLPHRALKTKANFKNPYGKRNPFLPVLPHGVSRVSLMNPLQFVSALPIGRRTLWRILVPIMPTSMRTVLLDVDGTWMHLDLSQNLDKEYAQGIYDREELEFLLAAYEQGSYFIDIGANQGLYSLLFAKRISNAKILAFEPDPYSFSKFQKNIAVNMLKNITACAYAISDGDEPKVLMINTTNNRGGSSIVVSQRPWQKEEFKMEVPCKTLAEALTAEKVVKVSALKIDIEGYEYPVLRRFFEDAPRELYPKVLVVEVFGHNIELVGGSPIELLIINGYKLVNHRGQNFFFELR